MLTSGYVCDLGVDILQIVGDWVYKAVHKTIGIGDEIYLSTIL